MRSFLSCFIFLLLLTGCEAQSPTGNEEEWRVSSLFQSGSYTMIGEEGKLGFIYDDTEAVKFYSGQSQKYMWHFWGEAEQLQGYPLQVIGTKKETGEQITVFKASALGGAINGADAHHPSVMALPSAGLWRLDAYIGEKFYGSVVVEIHEAH